MRTVLLKRCLDSARGVEFTREGEVSSELQPAEH